VEDLKLIRPNLSHENKVVAARLLPVSDLVQRYDGTAFDRFGVPRSGLGVLTALARFKPDNSPFPNSTATSWSLRAASRSS
jgi:hypothetical protein